MGKTVDEYMAGLEGWQFETVAGLVGLVQKTVPEADFAVKWAMPVFSSAGPFCFIKPAKSHLNFTFWRGVLLDDPQNLLQGEGEKMRHIKFREGDGLNAEDLAPLILQASRLNHTLGDPTRPKH